MVVLGSIKIKKAKMGNEEEPMLRDLKKSITYYEGDICQFEVVSFCKKYIEFLVRSSQRKLLEGEIKRTEKVLMSYYETGNSNLAYQQCLNIRNKYFSGSF